MPQGGYPHHPPALLERFPCLQGKQVSFLGASRVGRKEDVDGFFLPRLFHRRDRSSPLVVNVGYTGDDRGALRGRVEGAGDVSEAVGRTDQRVAGGGHGPHLVAHAFEVEAHVEVVTVNHTNPRYAPPACQFVRKMGHGPEGVADDDVGAPVTELLLHPTRSPANAGHGEAWVRMVGQREKPRDKGLDVVVKPAFGCFGHPHHGRAARFCVAWHARKRVDHLHVVVEVPQQMDVVLHEDARVLLCGTG